MSAQVFVELPLRLDSSANLREHWRAKARRIRGQRLAARLATQAALSGPLVWPASVTVTRIAPRALDGHDNLATAAKGIVDGIADALGLANDRDPRVVWHYAQGRRGVREYAVAIEIRQAI